MPLLGTIGIGIVKKLAPAVVIAYFTKERGEQHRESDRQRWWAFTCKAAASPGKADDAIATYLQARFNFHDSPEDKRAKDIARKAGVLNDEPPAGFTNPDYVK